MNNKRLWILLGGIVLFGAAFVFLNFRIAVSSTQADKLVFTTDMGENLPLPMQRREKISIVLAGDSVMDRALKKALREQLDQAGMGEIEMVQAREQVYPNPVLVVKVGKPGPLWTPLFAMSQFSIHAGYASDGDSTFFERVEETHTNVAKKDASNMYAEYDIKDRSLGLISRPGYHQFLADYFAQEIVAVLKGLYNLES